MQMKRYFKKPRSVGTPPGTLVTAQKEIREPRKLLLFEYGPDLPLRETEIVSVADCFPLQENVPVTWLNVSGDGQAEVLKEIGEKLDIHPLVLEDILDTSQRPKLEDFGRYLFIELNMLAWNKVTGNVEIEQVSLILTKKLVITFQEFEKDVFESVRLRIREAQGRLMVHGADYLAYRLVDAVVDHYFVILEEISEKVEDLEEQLVLDPEPETLKAIHHLKRELIYLRKSIWPLREVISSLERDESELIGEFTSIYLRDIYDHTIQIIDTVETFRDMVSGMMDIYLSSVSNRMNEVMKVLTIISTVFIPLSFIVGLYGMNFHYMPELNWKWGYPLVWLVIVGVVVGMLVYFRRKKWL